MTRGTRQAFALVSAFCAGAFVDAWLRVYGPPKPAVAVVEPVEPLETTMGAEPPPAPAPDVALPQRPLAPLSAAPPAPVSTTGRRVLRVPIDGIDVESMKGGFSERRAGHQHEAVDILAPRNTPVHAVQDGTIARLFLSKAGGLTIYQFDPSGRVVYYYAHLQRYADTLHESEPVKQGQVIGYVGTSGNAPPGTPHLHFAVFELGPDRRWWQGKAIDPYDVFRSSGSMQD